MSAPPCPGGGLDAVDLLEDVRRQTLDAVEIRHRLGPWAVVVERAIMRRQRSFRALGFFGRLGRTASDRRRRRRAAEIGSGGSASHVRDPARRRVPPRRLLTSASVRGARGAARVGGPDRSCNPSGACGRELRRRNRRDGATVGPEARTSRNSPRGIVAGSRPTGRCTTKGSQTSGSTTSRPLKKS